jgi:hypothetical protein
MTPRQSVIIKQAAETAERLREAYQLFPEQQVEVQAALLLEKVVEIVRALDEAIMKD